MKKFYLLVSLLLCSAILLAQPTVQYPQNAPEIGDVMEIHFVSTNGLSPDPTGPDQSWDYSELNILYGGQLNVIDPSAAPSGTSFPSASAVISMGDTIYTYVLANSDGYFYLGSESTTGTYPSVLVYSDSRTFLKFPFTFDDTYFDTYKGVATTSVASVRVSAYSEMFADAYGTLILPNGTYHNVLRTATIDAEIDSVFIGGKFVKSMMVGRVQYSWFAPDSKGPLMSMEILDMNGTVDTIAYYSSTPASIVDPQDQISQLRVFPNPAEDNINVAFETSQNAEATVSIVNQVGQLVIQNLIFGDISGQVNEAFEISHLPSGIYVVNVSCNCGYQITQKFVIR